MSVTSFALEKRKLYVVLLITTLLLSCQKKRVENGAPQSPPNDISLRADIESEPKANHYRVLLRWRSNTNPESWFLKRKRERGEWREFPTIYGDRREFLDTEVEPGVSYTYSLCSTKAGLTRETTITVFRDIEINGTVQFSEISTQRNLTVQRLYFSKRGRLITNGEDVVISADEIFSHEGEIETFRSSQTAPYGMNGRSGGRIVLRARSATGHLHLVARGENGGRGIPGKPVLERAERGQKGVDGECGYRGKEVDCDELPPHMLQYWRTRAETPGPEQQTYQEALTKIFCRIETGDGSPGVTGKPGEVGGNGGKGGDSGKLGVQVDAASNFMITHDFYPGEGGQGAPGGDGGPGGPGGDPGRQDRLKLCRIAYQGRDGKKGPPGSWGEKGKDGLIQTYCFRLGNHLSGECEAAK